MYGEPAPPAVDPYSDAYNAPPPATAPAGGAAGADRDPLPPRGRSRSRSRSPGYRSPRYGGRRPSPPPKRPAHAPIAPNPSNVLGVFGLSIRTTERDLEEEFSRFGRVEKVVIVYDQRQSDRSRGFGFITMGTVDEAARCVKELNGVDLNGRRIRVDYSVTDRPHAPTPGEYMGHRRRRDNRDSYYGRDSRDGYRDSYRDSRRGGGYSGGYDRDRDYDRGDRDYGRDRDYDRDRDLYGRDNRDWRDRRSPAPARGGGGRYSPEYRRRRSYSRSPPRGSSPTKGREYDAPAPAAAATNGSEPPPRW
ncbi:hypothetical protein JAAARDRAFT_43836 [Jaapia argillacea MUCL 33604]|uniref:RRM domain-containing protein n=1 Tax=Jaapia argillacea MUCL 33604 TaxID=933084 RepID=A0A067QFT1_9AGAM|nr:hypothetical protein JAAARDRAFT_43836 [Jaapia argillacea MUCL 33604]